AMKRANTTITFHSDGYGRQAHMAVNVTTLHMTFADVPESTEQQRESAWEWMVEDWWNEANVIAQEHGYEFAASEGRSGKWCVPSFADGTYPDGDNPK